MRRAVSQIYHRSTTVVIILPTTDVPTTSVSYHVIYSIGVFRRGPPSLTLTVSELVYYLSSSSQILHDRPLLHTLCNHSSLQEFTERTIRTSSILRFSMALSPPVPEHYRSYAASGCFQTLK